MIYCIFQDGKLLVREDSHALPDSPVLPAAQHILAVDESCCAYGVDSDTATPEGFVFAGLRALIPEFAPNVFGQISRAAQLTEWARTHQFCGVCATPMQPVAHERAMRCKHCGMTAYPRISPAMMVLIKKGDAVLLARHTISATHRFVPLAGFLEAGESVEDAIHREVMEEVGLRVRNLQYFGSQSWPFPHSLMLAFTADYVDGEIATDPAEIAEARWFTRVDMTERYPETSISGRLVNSFFANGEVQTHYHGGFSFLNF
ncbi:MAG: hypothetical protein RIR79_1461 [Pseudomonadota bacterium]|jgi:NAD+ diphosphatase